MSSRVTLATGSAGTRPTRADSWCLRRIASVFRGTDVRVELWDGTRVPGSGTDTSPTLVVKDRATLWSLVSRSDLAFGDAYTSGGLDVRGDLVDLLVSVNLRMAGRQRRLTPVPPPPGGATESSARHNVHVHYDLGNDFYRLWLDEQMVYTCAYFERPDMDLATAQRAKLDYVCRKIDLRPGEHVIEAGCGWGALALHMARCYDVTVDAYNVSVPQLDWARQRAVEEGLSARVKFINADYRAIEGTSDAFVSIGMLEHVGLRQYAGLGAAIDRVLHRAHGRALLHFIGRNSPRPFNAWTTRYIFPGAYAPSIGEVATRLLEPCGFSIVDVENLRLHYAETVRHWRDRFDEVSDSVTATFDERFVRTWRLYLASAEACFLSGDLQLFQVVFARPADDRLPWTRHLLYEDDQYGSV